MIDLFLECRDCAFQVKGIDFPGSRAPQPLDQRDDVHGIGLFHLQCLAGAGFCCPPVMAVMRLSIMITFTLPLL